MRYRRRQVKDLPTFFTWRLEWDSNRTQPLSYTTPTIVPHSLSMCSLLASPLPRHLVSHQQCTVWVLLIVLAAPIRMKSYIVVWSHTLIILLCLMFAVVFFQVVQVLIEVGHRAWYRKKATPDRTHDWILFVRGSDGHDLSHFVEKIVFNLHESFNPSRRGKYSLTLWRQGDSYPW